MTPLGASKTIDRKQLSYGLCSGTSRKSSCVYHTALLYSPVRPLSMPNSIQPTSQRPWFPLHKLLSRRFHFHPQLIVFPVNRRICPQLTFHFAISSGDQQHPRHQPVEP